MTKTLQIVPERIDAMTATFKSSMDELQETLSELNSIVQIMEEGALIGDAGTLFAEALRGSLTKKINDLHQKFEELSKDLQDTKNTIVEIDRNVKIN